MKSLQHFKKKYFSQFGEDGIVVEILNRISKYNNLDYWCSEFGAWDGVHLSNTCYLIRKKKFSAVLIEGSSKKIKDLKKNFPESRVHKICTLVNFEGKNTLDNIYKDTPIPKNFDFLSIDVDGVDYHIFDSLKKYKPKIICIEFNNNIPNQVEYIQPRNFKIKQGSSGRAIVNLANKKGYFLAAVTESNLIFVNNIYKKFITNQKTSLEDLNIQDDPTYIFTGYDGSILSNKKFITVGWHGIQAPLRSFQFLPFFFRKFYGDFGKIRYIFLLIYLLFKIPDSIWTFRKKIKSKLIRELKEKFRI